MTDNPYQRQEAGTHYVNMGMQPFHFAMVNGWDAGAFSILKYLSRHRMKNGLEDLKKARHFVDLRQAEKDNTLCGDETVLIWQYIQANKMDAIDAKALTHLERWVDEENDGSRIALLETIDLLMSEYTTSPLPS